VEPLAGQLKLEIDARIADDAYPRLVRELRADPKYAGKTVLVAWHHGNLPELAEALGATGVPKKWGDDVYDRVWVVTFGDDGRAGKLALRRQALLPGDARE
jgi:hypothetical protein